MHGDENDADLLREMKEDRKAACLHLWTWIVLFYKEMSNNSLSGRPLEAEAGGRWDGCERRRCQEIGGPKLGSKSMGRYGVDLGGRNRFKNSSLIFLVEDFAAYKILAPLF